MKSRMFLAVLLTICLFGCKDYGVAPFDDTSPNSSPAIWSLKYNGYDAGGSISATGTLHFAIDKGRVTGSWIFDDGREGTLAGTYDKGMLQIDLYPGYADHNLILTGKLSAQNFTGEWTLYGWAVLGRGSFVATVTSIVIVDWLLYLS